MGMNRKVIGINGNVMEINRNKVEMDGNTEILGQNLMCDYPSIFKPSFVKARVDAKILKFDKIPVFFCSVICFALISLFIYI